MLLNVLNQHSFLCNVTFVLYFVSCVNEKHLKSEWAQLRRCSTSVSTICVALLFPVIRGMSRNYLNSVHLIAFK